ALVPSLQSAYKGHGNDRDVQALLEVHPGLRGTAADSCETCHRAGVAPGPPQAPVSRRVSHCDYCHAVTAFGKKQAGPTLNAYGLAYREAGRGAAAVKAVGARDADGDGTPNDEELRQGTNPGEVASRPGAPPAPRRAYTPAELRALSPVVSARIFLNSTKSRTGDTYLEYRGNRIDQVLDAVGLDPAAESLDLISIDGYETTISLEEARREWKQPAVVPGLDRAARGECGWVSYGPGGPGAAALPAARILLAFEENGTAFEPARIDPASGRIVGKGPLRAIVPQYDPGVPDLPQTADPACAGQVAPEHRFSDAYDHNAGRAVSAVTAIRVNPLPPGTRDVDWRTLAGDGERVVIFGALRDGAGAR
ncbi:MAG: hypothetical protein KBA95_12115, partial [Acidobacteria bacterium]|nr:hypothetical protein [Acidobacteriota bacterium]